MSNIYTILMKLSCKYIKPNTRHGHDYEEKMVMLMMLVMILMILMMVQMKMVVTL